LSLSSQNPYASYNFQVEFLGIQHAAFTECILPVASIEVIEYRQGEDAVNNVHKLPGLVRYGNLVLKRGLASSMTIWDWFAAFVTGAGTPQTVKVILLDSARNPVITWEFSNAWPVRYESPPLGGKANALAIETLELAVEGMQMTVATSQEA
jgi:phage tail-like protein